MAGIMDYAATEFATFREKPLCEVDSLVFSQLAMVRMAGLVPLHQKDGRWAVRMRRAVQRFSGAVSRICCAPSATTTCSRASFPRR